MYYIGGIYILALGFAIVPGLSPKLWRLYIGICVVPAFFSFVLTFFLVLESPRYLAISGKHGTAIGVLNKMAEINKQ